MRGMMTWIVAAAAVFSASPAMAAAEPFTLVNQVGAKIESLSIRRFGTQGWQPLAGSPAAGARQHVDFSDPDCAFDIQAKLAGGATAVWSGVNLCEVTAVVLNRSASGATWADYQ